MRKPTAKNSMPTRAEEIRKYKNGAVSSWYAETRAKIDRDHLAHIPYTYNGAMREMEMKIRFQLHNKKLQPTDKIAFLIFSIPAVLTCPGATGLCLHNCYARSDERYTTTRASRLSNLLLSFRPDFTEMVCNAIKEEIYKKDGTLRAAFVGKTIIIRIHEAGDFYSVDYMVKWFQIAKKFPELYFFAYTKSFKFYDLVRDLKPDNFTMRASIWDDTPEIDLEIIKRHGMPFYMALPSLENIPRDLVCDCRLGCGKCGCKCRFNNNVYAEIV